MSFRFFLVVLIIAGGILCVHYSVQAYPDIFNVSVTMEKNNAPDVNPSDFLIINFSQSVLTQGYEKGIAITPQADLNIYWSDNNRKLTIAPKKFWSPETDYQLTLPEGKSIMLTQIKKMPSIFPLSNIQRS